MEMFEANKQGRDWILVANCSHPLTGLGHHCCSARLYWPHLPVECTTTAFVSHVQFLQAQALTWLPPAILKTTALILSRQQILSRADSPVHVCDVSGCPRDEGCGDPGSRLSSSTSFLHHPSLNKERCLSSSCRKTCGHYQGQVLSLKLLSHPLIVLLPTLVCPRHCDQVSFINSVQIITRPRNQQ